MVVKLKSIRMQVKFGSVVSAVGVNEADCDCVHVDVQNVTSENIRQASGWR